MAGADDFDDAIGVDFATLFGDGNGFLTGEVLTGEGLGVLHNFGGSAGGGDFAAMATGARSDIDDVVAGEHGVFVMFDDDDGIFEVAEVFESVDEFVVVALVEADGGFVENVEDALEARANLGGKANALGFATGEGVGGAAKGEIAETDILHKFDAGDDFFHDGGGDDLFAGGELKGAEGIKGLVDGEIATFEDVFIIDGDGEDGGF